MIAYYLTHSQVDIDPAVPVPDWSLSALGRSRIVAALGKPWLATVSRIVSSDERKAIEAASIVAGSLGIAYETHVAMGENDRSSTGFLEPPAFEAAADAFFAEPEKSWNGWERAIDAQARIVDAVRQTLRKPGEETCVLFVGHGAVGTLLKCWLARRPISRREDQPAGGGNLHAFSISSRRLLCDWTPIERFEGASHEH